MTAPLPTSAVVTGAAGWLGRALLAELAAGGVPVRALVRDADEALAVKGVDPTAETVTGDLRDPTAVDALFTAVDGPTVFHAGSVIHPGGGGREFFDVNVGGTALVVDRARRAGARRLVYVSSNSPFGFNPTADDVFDVDAPYHPFMGYGRSKMEAEVLVRRAHDAGHLETVIVRCPWFYGPHQPERQTRFFQMVRRGLFPLCGDGSNRRSLAYTEDLARGLVQAATVEPAAGRAYWLADREPYTMRRILDAVKTALAEEAGLPVARRQLRLPAVTSRVAELGDRVVQAAGRYSAQLHVLGEVGRTIACTTEAAERDLGFRPTVDVEEGMRRSVRWCLDHGLAL
jgi:nucleoside-diphosphate-sugar epimerase